MKNSKPEYILGILLKIAVAIVLVVAASTNQEYSFYTFLRWLVMAASIYFTCSAFVKKEIGLLVYFVVLATLFNPFHKFWFQKATWHLIDFIVAGSIIITVFFDIEIMRAKANFEKS